MQWYKVRMERSARNCGRHYNHKHELIVEAEDKYEAMDRAKMLWPGYRLINAKVSTLFVLPKRSK